MSDRRSGLSFSLQTMAADWLSWLPIVAAWIFDAWAYPHLPAHLVIHWGINGQPNGWSGRNWAVLFAAGFPVVIYLFVSVLPLLDPQRENYTKFSPAFRLMRSGVTWLLVAVNVIIIGSGLGWQLNLNRWMPVIVGLLFALMGNVMGQVRHNYFVGIRTPWTLANEEVWRQTHRLGAKLLFAAGVVTVLAGLMIPAYSFWVLIAALVIAALGSTAYSYLVFQRIAR